MTPPGALPRRAGPGEKAWMVLVQRLCWNQLPRLAGAGALRGCGLRLRPGRRDPAGWLRLPSAQAWRTPGTPRLTFSQCHQRLHPKVACSAPRREEQQDLLLASRGLGSCLLSPPRNAAPAPRRLCAPAPTTGGPSIQDDTSPHDGWLGSCISAHCGPTAPSSENGAHTCSPATPAPQTTFSFSTSLPVRTRPLRPPFDPEFPGKSRTQQSAGPSCPVTLQPGGRLLEAPGRNDALLCFQGLRAPSAGAGARQRCPRPAPGRGPRKPSRKTLPRPAALEAI